SLNDQTLDLSRIEAGRVTLEETNFDLRTLLGEVEDLFSSRVKNKGFALRFERAPDAPRHVRTDREKLRRVLIHLLENAITYTKEGAVTVRLKTSPGVSARKISKVSRLTFEVEDTGPGVAPGELKTIFKAFVQSETGGNSQKGVGLGLTISREFVRLMGGEIQVKSAVGRGTTFTFHIRAGVVDAPEMETGRPVRRVIGLAPNQPRFRILVADDRENSRQLLVRILKPFDFDLREAENGRDAIDIW
ncbi:MAG: hypothetical protein GY859_05055, partial [Desulfobacterales bacterium]|nr:hypothetical protein [Desulfobacterales bacterium]